MQTLYLGTGQYTYITAESAGNRFFTVGANELTSASTGNGAVNNGLKVGLTAATGPQQEVLSPVGLGASGCVLRPRMLPMMRWLLRPAPVRVPALSAIGTGASPLVR